MNRDSRRSFSITDESSEKESSDVSEKSSGVEIKDLVNQHLTTHPQANSVDMLKNYSGYFQFQPMQPVYSYYPLQYDQSQYSQDVHSLPVYSYRLPNHGTTLLNLPFSPIGANVTFVDRRF